MLLALGSMPDPSTSRAQALMRFTAVGQQFETANGPLRVLVNIRPSEFIVIVTGTFTIEQPA